MAHRARSRRSRALVPTLALVALALPLTPAVAAPGGAAPAAVSAAASDPSDPVVLMPESNEVKRIMVTDTAIYAVTDCHPGGCALVERALEADGDVVRLGPPTLVSRVASAIVDEDGRLAYVRSYDQRLVLQDVNGQLHEPAWGAVGVWADRERSVDLRDLRGDWIVDQWTGVFDLTTGEQQEMPESGNAWLPVHRLGNTLVATWVTRTTHQGPMDVILATVLDGGVPDTTLLDELFVTGDWGALHLVGVVEDTVVWWRLEESDGGERTFTLRWRPAPGVTGEMAGSEDNWPRILGGELVMAAPGNVAGSIALTWLDVSTSEAQTTRTATVPSTWIVDGRGSLIAYADDRVFRPGGGVYVGTKWLIDLDGRAIIADQTPLELPGWFADIAWDQPFIGDIAWLVDHGVTGGYTDGTFRPYSAVTRGQMAAFLYRMAGEPEVDLASAPRFTDVPTHHSFAEPIAWLAGTGITTGHADGTFRPGGAVTRGQMAAFLARFAGQELSRPSRAPFTDVPTGHTFAAEIAWLATTGVTRGNTDGTYRPSASVNRQHMAAFLHRFDRAGLTP